MKRLLLISISLMMLCVMRAQTGKTEVLQDLERNNQGGQDVAVTAVLKSASRLFADPSDLTSVILIVPKDSIVEVLNQDPDYLYVFYKGYEGSILRSHADVKEPQVPERQQVQQHANVQEAQPAGQEPRRVVSRFAYLEGKYGSSMAARLDAGKIWKGMTAEMVQDSWGVPQKINRVISGNNIREEWIYRNSWLFFENDRLIEWGPVRR